MSEGANPPPSRRRRKVPENVADAKPPPGEDRMRADQEMRDEELSTHSYEKGREDERFEQAARSPTVVAREGDTLHVRFPEVTLPLRAKYASAKVGGLSMTRALREGEGVAEAGREMAVVLRELSLEIARATIDDFDAELKAAREGR